MSQNEGTKNTPVDIGLLCTFKRMRRFKPREAVIEALKESDFLDVVYVEERPKVKRRIPLAEPDAEDAGRDEGKGINIVKVFEDRAMPRSVYAKGFGEELATTQFDIENFFAQFGPTNAIRLRRADDRTFKRSVFVEFDSKETAQKFLAIDPKPKYNGKELLIMSKKAYVDGKAADIASGKIKPHSRPYTHKRRRGSEEDTRDWRTRRDEDRRTGFRNDKKQSGHNNRSGRGDRGGRDERKENGAEKDQETIDALAKARVVVEEQEKLGKENQTLAESKKRAREDDEDAGERPEKKANTHSDDDADGGEPEVKPEVANGDSAGKKRAREDDVEEEAPALKKPALETTAS